MHLCRTISTLIFSILLIQKAQSQTADEIIQKHIEAIGGYERIKTIKAIVFEGTSKSDKLETSFKSYIIHDSAACTEGIANGKPSKGIITKKEGWIYTPGSSKNSIQKKSKNEIKNDQKALDIHGPLVDYVEKRNKIKYLGKEKVNGMECFKLKLIKTDKSTFIYYFDSTYFIARIIALWPRGNLPELTFDYTYITFDNGYSFVVRSVRLEDTTVTTYKNYIINPEIDRAIFRLAKN